MRRGLGQIGGRLGQTGGGGQAIVEGGGKIRQGGGQAMGRGGIGGRGGQSIREGGKAYEKHLEKEEEEEE